MPDKVLISTNKKTMRAFLASGTYIDFENGNVSRKADELSAGLQGDR